MPAGRAKASVPATSPRVFRASDQRRAASIQASQPSAPPSNPRKGRAAGTAINASTTRPIVTRQRVMANSEIQNPKSQTAGLGTWDWDFLSLSYEQASHLFFLGLFADRLGGFFLSGFLLGFRPPDSGLGRRDISAAHRRWVIAVVQRHQQAVMAGQIDAIVQLIAKRHHEIAGAFVSGQLGVAVAIEDRHAAAGVVRLE